MKTNKTANDKDARNNKAPLKVRPYPVPERLKLLPQPPKQLHIVGSDPDFDRPVLSVVGTRKPTPYGKEIVDKFVSELASMGVIIASGLAVGTDGLAHRAALSVGGTTVAILPSPADQIYPRSHGGLALEIIKTGGAIISEYNDHPHPAAFKSRFIERNRLVSGISNALLIIEAASKSGTMHTANFSLDQGRTVMVIPGNITSVMSAGTNNLIKEGALPVTSVEDILQVLGLDRRSASEKYIPKTPDEAVVLDLINSGVRNKQELVVKSGLEPARFNIALTALEIAKVL